jgi:hypothetical protein
VYPTFRETRLCLDEAITRSFQAKRSPPDFRIHLMKLRGCPVRGTGCVIPETEGFRFGSRGMLAK